MPEGDPKDLPPPPKFDVNESPDLQYALPVSGRATLARALVLDGLLPRNVPANASMKIVAQFPDGSVHPLVWLQNYDPRYPHPFLLRHRVADCGTGWVSRNCAGGSLELARSCRRFQLSKPRL